MSSMILFLVGVVLCIAAVFIYAKAESDHEKRTNESVAALKVEYDKQLKTICNRLDMLEGEEDVGDVETKFNAVKAQVEALGKDNEISKVRLNTLDKRLRELPRTVDVNIVSPVELKSPKPAVVSEKAGRGIKALIDKAGGMPPGKLQIGDEDNPPPVPKKARAKK